MQAKNKIINSRTCIYSNKQYPKDQLLRIVKRGNKLEIDLKQNQSGRGYYIHVTPEIFKDNKLSLIISKRTRCTISSQFIEELQKYENIEK